MSDFSTQWLALRESADVQARSTAPAQYLNAYFAAHSERRIVDLGCGTGANLRWLQARLDAPQHWHLIDKDSRLLAEAVRIIHNTPSLSPLSVHTSELDLDASSTALDTVLADADLVSASALLDLVSAKWLRALLQRCAPQRTPLLFALNYDGRMSFTPSHRADSIVRDALNRDQHSDKGFGAALGPDCAASFSAQASACGYAVGQWRSDWVLARNDTGLHQQLIDDLAAVAHRVSTPGQQPLIEQWRVWRHDALAHSTLRIGHVDLLAIAHAR